FLPSVENSLRQLKSDYVDLLLLHWPSDDHANDTAIELLQVCHEKKFTRLMGVSNFNMEQLKKAQRKIPVFCNQIEYHPFIDQHKIVKYLQDNDMLITAYTPLARGRVGSDSTIVSIAKKYGRTPAQVTLQWLLRQKNVSPIPKAGNETHLKENLEALNFEISNEDAEAIAKIKS
ncbi:MAG: aldo/keto reductase, partial [Bacteroidia bacterium]|nr:aldo/keto reductase [Bacteroidia bacterium]